MRRIEGLHYVMIAVMMMFLATACSESNTDEKPEDPTKPETPVSDGDWQTVPVGGGTIEKGDITIDFPKGTFDKDSKVAITSLEKGKIGGKYEASKFYMVTIPSTTNKNITIRLKSTEKGGDIRFVMESPGLATSTGEEVEIESYLDAKYSNGEYVATLPAIANGNEVIDNLKLTFGVAHLPQNVALTRGTTMGGQVGTVKWEIKYALTSLPYWDLLSQSKLNRIEGFMPILNECIEKAITQINRLGFKIEENRELPVYLVGLSERWGQHNQSTLGNSHNSISINYEKMAVEKPDTVGLRNTVIHELFHYFQAEFDPRLSYLKGRTSLSPTAFIGGAFDPEELVSEVLVMQEMGSAWIEQFTNDGQLDAKFLSKEALGHAINFDQFGFTDIQNCWSGNKREKYQNQGYSMAPMLYYITSQLKTINGEKIGNDVVLEFFQECKKHHTDIQFLSNTYNCLYDVLYRHECYFLIGDGTEDYILKLLKGELVKGLYIHTKNIIDKSDSTGFSIKDPQKIANDGTAELSFNGSCYPYGCSIRQVSWQKLKEIDLTKKRLTIKQETEGMKTFLLVTDSKSNYTKFVQIEKTATKQDSIVVEGNQLEKMRLDNGEFQHDFFLVTMRTDCNITDAGKKKDYKLSFELRDTLATKPVATITPRELTFQTGGGTKSANVDGYDFKHIGFDTPPSWLTVKVNDKDKSIEFTAQPNLTGKERTDTVKCYVTNADKPTDKDKMYLPVKVTQDGTPPTVSPTPLTFEAEGGMQTLTIKVQGYKYCGCIIDDDAKSWLSKNYVSGGLYEVTAEPNTTNKERTTTIRCYVANEKNAPDDKRIYMEVQVAQLAGQEQTAKYQFAYGFVEMTIYTDIDGNNTMGRIDFEATDKFLTVSSNGKGLHFDINYKVNETNYSESVQCQFDIDDLSLLENKKSNVTNLSWKVDTNNKGGRSWAGVWAGGGDGWLVSQTQKIRFSTNSKIPEMDFEWGDDGTRSVNWYAYDNDISPSECTYDRSSTTISEEVGVVIDKGKGMQDGSNIWISLHFKEVAN